MPTFGEVDVPPDEAGTGVVAAPSVRDPAAFLFSDLPPLKSIWECPMLEKGQPAVPHNGKSDGWRCRYCGEVFYPVHSGRATHHVAKEPNGSIAICQAAIPERNKARCVFIMLLLLSRACLTPIFLFVRP